ncbi:MAG TPA: RHS repeat domain-containing protein [Thermoanaerobaculia bacterium]|nr:RHS repeat domain-containing protein [Thermoanaerobaculia bacterium]
MPPAGRARPPPHEEEWRPLRLQELFLPQDVREDPPPVELPRLNNPCGSVTLACGHNLAGQIDAARRLDTYLLEGVGPRNKVTLRAADAAKNEGHADRSADFFVVALPPTRRTAYAYDELGRLLRVEYPDGTVVTYAYDLAGNRTALTVSPPPQ